MNSLATAILFFFPFFLVLASADPVRNTDADDDNLVDVYVPVRIARQFPGIVSVALDVLLLSYFHMF